MEFPTRHLLLVVLISGVFSKISTAPAQSLPSAGSPEMLHNIIIELENVLYKLKDYARAIQAAGQREAQQQQQVSDKASELDLSELQAAVSRNQQSNPKSRPNSNDLDTAANSDVSLREALEYLVGLAKQKKIERRDHDIPFPLNDRENQ